MVREYFASGAWLPPLRPGPNATGKTVPEHGPKKNPHPSAVGFWHLPANSGGTHPKLSIYMLGEKEMDVCSWGLVVSITKC